VPAISKRTATVWAGMVAGTVLVVVVAMALVSGQGPAGAQSEQDVLTGPTLQFGCGDRADPRCGGESVGVDDPGGDGFYVARMDG
jgi:hypothetical protein